MKRILIFIDWFLPGYKAGGPISSNANLIEHFKGEFEFFIITRDTDYCETVPYTTVVPNTWNTLSNGAKVYYFTNQNLNFKNLIQTIKTIDFDIVYINGIYSLYFSLFPLIWFKLFTHKKVVVAARGMLSDHTFSSKKSKKKIFYGLAKAIKLYKGITFHATNEDEAKQIRKNVGFKGEIKIAPNLPPKVQIQQPKIIEKKKGELRLISIARISEEKNTLFALKILENIKYGDVVFDLFGTIYSQSYWYECQNMIKKLPQNIKVNFCGSINKEIIPSTLCKYHFLLMPSQGENYGHSIVESMLAGCPVIISDRTPWKNLYPEAGWDIPLEKPDDFTQKIEYCIQINQNEYNTMRQQTFNYAQQMTKSNEILKANKNLFQA